MDPTRELSVVVPAFQEGSHLYSSISCIRQHVQLVTSEFEILIVDDGSSDTTWTEINRLAKEFPEVRGLRLSRNFGKDAALWAGLASCHGRAVLTLDADLQHPPSAIAAFYYSWKHEGFDVVEGVKRNRFTEPVLRRMASVVFNRFASHYTGFELTNSTDFKLMDRKVVTAMLELKERRVFFRGLVAWLGFRRKQVLFDVDRRAGGESKWSAQSLCRLALTAVVAFTSAPLRIGHAVAVVFLVFALLLGSRAVYLKMAGAALSGFTTVIIVQLLVGALTLMVLGIIAEYLAAVYDELKGRPRYFVAEALPPLCRASRPDASGSSGAHADPQ